MKLKKLTLSSSSDILALALPFLLYPAILFPFMLWGVKPFANVIRIVVTGETGNAMWVAFNGPKTVVFFWGFMAALVMLICIIISIWRLRPWYFIPLYLVVAGSLSGICSFIFYTIMVRYYGFG